MTIRKLKIKCLTLVSFILLASLTACSNDKAPAATSSVDSIIKSSITELVKIDNFIGTGKRVHNNHRLAVHYTGWLFDESAKDQKGKKFDSSRDRNRPFVFSLGNRDVIAGWEQGILGMKIGGKRTLIIPSELAYGVKGSGSLIPPNAALVFDIEILQAG